MLFATIILVRFLFNCLSKYQLNTIRASTIIIWCWQDFTSSRDTILSVWI